MNHHYELTNQERRILLMVTHGKRNAAIAAEMFLSVRTVENHLYHIFDKLGVSSRTEAAIYALNTGLIASAERLVIAGGSETRSGYLGEAG